MTNERLTLTGWLAIIEAVLSIPIAGLDIFAGAQPRAELKLIAVPLNLIPFALRVYVLVSFKSLLNSHFHFHDTDLLIQVLIGLNVVAALLSIIVLLNVALETPALETVVRVVGVLLMSPFGIMIIVFGIKLLRLPDPLHGLLKPYAYTTIAAGFCIGIIVLFPVGFLIGSVAGILLGMIFLFVRAADGARAVASS
jgi:hypothetical protein